ncbi:MULTISPECIES: replication protein [Xenorhabdus]|uniref:replication protein n=1 Tax=Xenorhabdus TaxID=626 RepID=UPI0006499056|nr:MULTISPECIES: replication protein [Xenorhabdus]KLU17458.1 replication protein [Xenorhabdus griffiniae]KOP34688.1 replication protein [Xenorhabdus sp. GDc328]
MGNVAYADFGAKNRQERPTVANLEDGFTRVANELLDAVLLSGFTEIQLHIVVAIWRKTYGYNKKMDWISNEQFQQMTTKDSTKCSTAKNQLIKMKVLIQSGRQIGMNKNISEWETKFNGFSKSFTKSVKKSFTESVNRSLPNQSNTKDNITKDKKDNKNILPEPVQAECKKPPLEPTKQDQIQSAFENTFWIAGMRKVGKPKALSSFKSQFKEWRSETKGTPEQFAEFLAEDIRLRLQAKVFGFENLHPATYLNQQRWTDEKPITNTPTKPAAGQSGITVSESGLVFLE